MTMKNARSSPPLLPHLSFIFFPINSIICDQLFLSGTETLFGGFFARTIGMAIVFIGAKAVVFSVAELFREIRGFIAFIDRIL